MEFFFYTHTGSFHNHHIMVEKGGEGAYAGSKSLDSQVRVHCVGERMVGGKKDR